MSESWRMSFSVSFAMGEWRHLSQRAFAASPPGPPPIPGSPQFAGIACGSVDRMATDRSALVTGGTGGLGAAVVGRLLDDGWRVVVPWIAERELGRVERREGLELVQADLFEPEAVGTAVVQAAGHADAPLRGGREPRRRLPAGRTRARRRRSSSSRRSCGSTCARPTSSRRPRCRTSSRPAAARSSASARRAALQPFAGAAGYVAAKAGVIAFAQAVAVEYRDEGVRCNALLPSVIDTPANRAAMPRRRLHDVGRNRRSSPRTIAFLCSEDGAATSGAAIPVYGRA